MSRPPQLSVVVPTYACATCLHPLHQRLTATLRSMAVQYELIFVDDRATDGSWDVLAQLASGDPHTRAYRLSRNFGQHLAISAGLSRAAGDWVVVMDCDLQDPPEEIPRLYAKALEGHDIVFARRMLRPGSRLRGLLARLYFALLNRVAGTRIDPAFGTFSIISRKVVDAYLQFGERDRHYLFILYWLGFNPATIDYEYAQRHSGRSSYRIRQLLRHAVDGMVFQTTSILRWIVQLGIVLFVAGGLLGCYVVAAELAGASPPEWTALTSAALLMLGLLIACIGAVGLYVGKIFEQGHQRPLYVFDEAVGEDPDRPVEDAMPTITTPST